LPAQGGIIGAVLKRGIRAVLSESGSSIGIGGVIWMIILFPRNRNRYRKDIENPYRDDDPPS
jgi:hypothetical protein